MVDLKISDERLSAYLKLPKDYLPYSSFVDGSTQNAVRLRMEIDDLEPLTNAEYRAMKWKAYFKQFGFAGKLNWLVQSFVVEGLGNAYSVAFASEIGVLKEVLVDEATAIKNFPHQPAEIAGLVKPIFPADEGRPFHGTNAFAAVSDGGDITDVLICKQVGRVPYPNCIHYFRVEPFSVKLTYSRLHLPHWHSIHQKAERLMGCILKEYSWK